MVNFESFVEAIILKFLGNFTTASSWLIQTDFFFVRYCFVNKEDFFLSKIALPNSLFFFEGLIFPPYIFAINCNP